MSNSCNEKNPLVHSGTSQAGRVLKALLPENAHIDERDDAELILFASRYAACINFYDVNNEVDGNWQSLMMMDVSVVLATVGRQDTRSYFDYISSLLVRIKEESNPAKLKRLYKNIFDFIFTLAVTISEQYKQLPDEIAYKELVRRIITSNLSAYYHQLKEYYIESELESLLLSTDETLDATAPVALITSTKAMATLDASSIWNYTLPSTFETYINGNSQKAKIKNTASHTLFTGILDGFLKHYARVIQEASKALQATLDDFPKHSPHYALYLTFIKLFRYAQKNLNTYTARHLRFYYRDVLRMLNKPSEPDKAHLILTLAKNTALYALPAGSVFKGGKNALGQELLYSSTQEVVLSKATVKQLCAVYTKSYKKNNTTYPIIYAAGVVNSGDGTGGAISSADGSWATFGDENIPEAELGFAVSSPVYFMADGDRTAKVRMELKEAPSFTDEELKGQFYAKLTGKKGWIKTDAVTVTADDETNTLTFAVSIPPDTDAIVPFDKSIHNGNFSTADPVLQILYVNHADTPNVAPLLLGCKIIKVRCGCVVNGSRNYVIQNDQGALNPAKPFQLFGAVPHLGASLIIGSHEILGKNIQNDVKLALNIEWNDFEKIKTAVTGTGRRAEFHYFSDGNWNEIKREKSDELYDFKGSAVQPDVRIEKLTIPKTSLTPAYDANSLFDTESLGGYLRLSLSNKDYGHSIYVQQLMEYGRTGSYHTSYPSASSGIAAPPPEPLTPSVKSLTIDYHTFCESDLSSKDQDAFDIRPLRFFHVHPLGNCELDTFLDDDTSLRYAPVPQYASEGELYIGLVDAKPEETVSILFQVSDGSSDPFVARQTIEWYYLGKNNRWKKYDTNTLVDATRDFTCSGIIKFTLASDMATAASLLEDERMWIRAVIPATGGACRMLSIQAQAVQVQLTDAGKSGVSFSGVLPAGSISKLQVSRAEIKSIVQPYDSYSGKTAESDEQFNRRVSERLRHKDRAVSIWDYEHLLLQQFESLYKVKCLNHHFVGDADYELRPGCVTVVAIPDLNGKSAVNPLRPYTPVGTITDMELFLKKRISPFVNLKVVNPVFEEIQLDFKVKFRTDDNAYYHDVLTNDIEAFLTPWAFKEGSDISFGGSIRKSVLINFIEERSYVDYITCVKMYVWKDGTKITADVDEATATTARSILVSFGGNASEPKHKIDYNNVSCNC